MLNGRCKVWKDENGNFHATLALDTPKGVIKMQRSAALTDAVGSWDPTAPETGPGTLIKKKVEYIAGFFPTEEVVGEKAYRIASELVKRRTNPETAALAHKQINTIKNAALAGDDEAFDIDYAIRKIAKGAKREQIGSMYARGVMDIVGDEAETSDTFDASLVGPQTEIGLSFRKLKRFVKKAAPLALMPLPMKVANVKKLATWVKRNPVKAIVSSALPPVAAYNLIRAGKKRNPTAIQKIAEVRRLADGLPPTQEAPLPEQPVIEEAQKALENMRMADAFEAEGVTPEFQEQYAEEAAQYEEDTAEGDAVGSFLGDLKKKLRTAVSSIDPSRPGSFMRPLLSNIPIVGSGVKAGLDLLDQAKKLNPSAIEKIKTVKSLAQAGVPKALAAEANLKAAQELSKEAEKLAAKGASTGRSGKSWFPFMNTYRAGLNRSVA